MMQPASSTPTTGHDGGVVVAPEEPSAPTGKVSLLAPLQGVDTPLSPSATSRPPPKTTHDKAERSSLPNKILSTDANASAGLSTIRFLDGLRGLAAMMVVVAHTNSQTTVNLGPPAADVFFVLSAFLLTLKCEKRVTTLFQQRASRWRWAWALLDYAQRRFLRVYPLFVIVAVYLSLQSPEDQKKLYDVRNEYDLWGVLTFQKEQRYFVLWTLPLELAYYVFIPIFAVAVFKLGDYWWVPLPPTLGFITYAGVSWYRSSDQPLGLHFPTFLTGSIAAVVYARVDAWVTETQFVARWYHTLTLRLVESIVFAILLSVMLDGLVFHWIAPNPVPSTAGFRFVHGNVAVVLVCEMLRPGPLAAALEWSILRFAGKISFSIYLWHGIVVHAAWIGRQPSSYDRFVSSWGLVFLVATISFYAFEAPCQRIARYISHWIQKRDTEEAERQRMQLPTFTPVPEAVAADAVGNPDVETKATPEQATPMAANAA